MHGASFLKIGVLGSLVLATAMLTACGEKPHYTWEEDMPDVRPQLVRKSTKWRNRYLHQELTKHIDIAYVMHQAPGRYAFITKSQLEQWNISLDTLHKTAKKNLDEASEDIDLQVITGEDGKKVLYVIVETGDGYDAVRLMLDSLQKTIKSHLGEPYIAAVPTRNFLIFWRDGSPLHNQFASQVLQEYEAEQEVALAPELFRISSRGLEVSTVFKKEE